MQTFFYINDFSANKTEIPKTYYELDLLATQYSKLIPILDMSKSCYKTLSDNHTNNTITVTSIYRLHFIKF